MDAQEILLFKDDLTRKRRHYCETCPEGVRTTPNFIGVQTFKVNTGDTYSYGTQQLCTPCYDKIKTAMDKKPEDYKDLKLWAKYGKAL